MKSCFDSVCHYFLALLLDRQSRGKEGVKVSNDAVSKRLGIEKGNVYCAVEAINKKLITLDLFPVRVYTVGDEEIRYEIRNDFQAVVRWRLLE
jgi:hypothetical protein